MFKNLKPDAMPRPPRSTSYTEDFPDQPQVHVDIEDLEEEGEEIVIEPEDDIKKKPKKKFFKSKKTTEEDDEILKPNKTRHDCTNSMNVQGKYYT